MHLTRSPRFLTLVFLLSAGLLLPACGGGGGGGGAPASVSPTALFSSEYVQAGVAANETPGSPTTITVFGGDLFADGADDATWSFMDLNADSSVLSTTNPARMPKRIYTVNGSREIRFDDGGLIGGRVAEGHVSSSGGIVVAGYTRSTAFEAFVRRSDVLTSVAGLTGSFHMAGYSRSIGTLGTNDTGFTGTVTFDGTGGLVYDRKSVNFRGAVLLGTSAPGTYTVDPTGLITMTIPGATLRGRMDATGELIVLSGSSVDGEGPVFLLLTPQATGLGNDDLDGAYYVAGIDIPSGIHIALRGNMDATDTDRVSLLVVKTSGGITQAEALGPYSNEVFGDGRVELSIGGTTYQGFLSPSGNVFLLGSPTTTPNNGPSIWIGIRK